jgi:hypothetical protein
MGKDSKKVRRQPVIEEEEIEAEFEVPPFV